MEYLIDDKEVKFPSFREFEDVIKGLPNWKAAGIDGVYNFFIKKISALHVPLYESILKIVLEGKDVDIKFYKRIIYLIPKGTPIKGSEFRPITCMSNLYKLTTKCVTRVMQGEVERRGLLSSDQLGTVRMVQGARELALFNTTLNKQYGSTLKTLWVDVKKAFALWSINI